MHDESSIPARKHIISTTERSRHGHVLVEVAERIPGGEPTDAEHSLSEGPTYESTYWRCRQCGQERTHWSGFLDDCQAKSKPRPLPDGGFDPLAVPEQILQRAQYEAYAFTYLDGHIQVRNESYADPDDHKYLVRVESGTPVACTCPADMRSDHPCKHRVALAIRRPVLSFITETESAGTGPE